MEEDVENVEDVMIDLVALVAAVAVIVHEAHPAPVIQHDSLITGNLYYQEVMETRNVHRFSNVVRMDKPTFTSLLQFVCEFGDLLIQCTSAQAKK